ncbi:MAG: hypothetical protein JNJ82_09755 [Opitutaceae bacterium]|nr:hypothetical protein [Opitutaceae bacterium]
MLTPLMHRLGMVAGLLSALGSFALPAMAAGPATGRVVDFRYGIPTWHQPLGVPEDWHKPLANERGALLYDFGPGPYVQPLTTVEWGAEEGPAWTVVHQDWVESPRIPAVRTRLQREGATMDVTTLAVPPVKPAISEGREKRWERLDGISGAPDWARVTATQSPEFRNVAWGINRPVRYRFRVEPGAAKRVMLGFNESYKIRLYDRTTDMKVEGAPVQRIDLGLNAELNTPQVFLFEASDVDRNGWIDVTIFAVIGRDPNTTLATIAVYPAGLTLYRADLVAGSKGAQDRAELRIPCGTEMSRQEPRIDLVQARYSGKVQPALLVKTKRTLTVTPDGVVRDSAGPFVVTQPRALEVKTTESGLRLVFPAGTTEVAAWVLSGRTDAGTVAEARALTPDRALALHRERWSAYAIPYGRITVADTQIQRIIDSSIRTLYQARESINGQSQFNSSFTLYRGLWAGDANDIAELATILGDAPAGRETLGLLWDFQDETGLIDELPPLRIFRGTPQVILATERDAQITGNWDFVRSRWAQIRRANEALRRLREQTLAQPDSPVAGLFPPGFNDGGIIDITSEYSTVYWVMAGLEASQRMAKRLGHTQDAEAWARFAQDLTASFERHRQRDLRPDAKGNRYLPVRVNVRGEDPIPSLAQWAVVQTHVFANWLPLDADFARSTFAMLVASEKQGLPASTGWLPDGIWAGYGGLFGHWTLAMGYPEKTADQLYAIANHASRLGTWVEEQSVVGAPVKLAGDQPHCWASTMFTRLAGYMLAHDRNDTVHLLPSVPAEWLRAGAVNRLDRWGTGAGQVTLSLEVSADGKTARLQVEPIVREDKSIRVVLHTDSLTRAGFSEPAGAVKGRLEVKPGQRVALEMTR